MKKYYVYLSIIFVAFVQISCQDKKQTSEADTTANADTTAKVASLENYSVIFQAVLKSDAGMARGVSIGDNIETIQETTLPAETQPENGKGFTEYFDSSDLNFADIAYLKDTENKVGAISIDIYIERQTAVDSLMNEFKGYFDKKYGQGKGISKMTTWKLSDSQNELLLQNVSTAKDPGLKIIFAKSGDKILQ
ncbi:hypothetical protein VB796_16760 [Arcicella sp. LKC2W]|uniref:hypothetical protein n=1 Tax=Arcicella sp. LKC2W TaxID=2984198 RepID=UPI002B1FEFC2|nr:hypothetical protein [Arcicella sp. LKC2W]MEA5460711.1 hypothetical protein [Arcicella sp. LKC2W]